ncbi:MULTISPECIES: hypothetical protein [Galbibacter]|uniref:Uncharacterized protein n=1 Tax=Galbibacter pacificus TaxID=2996052 RepID=A0ABT6FV40_9FLAO|nr:hypothetical protein [Galbibacter pacificus]MDG3583388.1 hypothetical protein [Galbibacter pacificus]MDG3587135.1 hypothetical protein [Galbibacter pacificus]
MKPKTKALLYNLIGFVGIFLILRFTLLYLFPVNHIVLVLIAAVVASVLAPKFAVVNENGKEQIKMKWIFLKGFRNIN